MLISPDVSTLIFHHCNLSLLHMMRVAMCSDLLCCNEEVEALILSLELLVQMESQAEC